MGKNYHINLNPREPSREEIQRHQDFDALLEQFESSRESIAGQGYVRPLLWWYTGTAAAAALALLVFFLFLRPDRQIQYQRKAAAHFAAQEYLSPPFKGVTPQFASLQVDGDDGGVYEYSNGSRLVVPKSAFMTDRGQAVAGQVSIHYREFHDYVDFFLSGIPMVYDSAGTRYNLESAGMIEIYAEQNGQRIRMAPGKSIEVELVSVIQAPNMNIPPRYNIYKLDTAARNWVYQDIDRIQFIEDENLDISDPLYPYKKELADAVTEIDASLYAGLQQFEREVPRPIPPVKPHQSAGDQPTLEVDLSDEDQVSFEGGAESAINQLKTAYGNVIWQIAPESPTYDERAFRVNWEEVRLNKINDRDYELSLIHGEHMVRLIVNPVLTAPSYDNALQLFEKAYTAYQQELADWEAQQLAKQRELESQADQARSLAQQRYTEQVTGLEATTTAEEKSVITRRKVVNRFKADSFGVWNCDRPISPTMAKLRASFVDKSGQTFEDCTVFLVDKSQNTLYRFFAAAGTPLHFNTDSENVLWIVTKDQKLAVFRPEDFKRINKKKGAYTFELKALEGHIGSEADVRSALQL